MMMSRQRKRPLMITANNVDRELTQGELGHGDVELDEEQLKRVSGGAIYPKFQEPVGSVETNMHWFNGG
jgi:hypothetical protein